MTSGRSQIFFGVFSDILFNILPLMKPLIKCLELTLESKMLVDFKNV